MDASLLAADDFHPGAPAYRIWAELPATSLRQRVAASVGVCNALAPGPTGAEAS
ncbi:hypothetical protein H7A76_27080 [Pseudomonas sp. MSSRFD41]|uniref:hypothetical protein n=1 Tax=Pseudomonas sp. MSSRFD41 TaxID=1310370 RepID=UPI00163AF022|nr:hypothetical protein [Pseudomonas sp. MSSRFD41]MBC2659119.1 hypothetical protein [Pseudomonas sp. MSSRFD41]